MSEQDQAAAVSVVSQRSVGDLTGLSLGSNLEIQERIGRGGMGSVYLARHRDWNLSLAVKSPRPDLLSSDTDKERWLLEAQTWIDLGVHPNIVRCWFIREHQGIPLLFLDYISGGSLKEAIEQRRYGVANWPRVLDLAIQACDGLHHAHVCGIVHRDVKPANLLLDEEGRVFVTDFGLVKLAGSAGDDRGKGQVDLNKDASLTSTGTVLGTPNYCAPEQWMQEDVGVPADLYAMGVVLYEMAVGQLPFEAGPGPLGLGQLLAQVLSEEPQPPSQLQPSIPPALESCILRLLSKDPRQRHATAYELREELAAIYQDITKTPYPRPVPKPVEAVVDVLNNKAVSLYSLGRKKPAEDTWLQALRLDSLHPEVVYNRGWLLWRQGRQTPAELAAALKQVKNTYPRGAVHCGLAYLLGGEAELAEQNLDSAVKVAGGVSDSSVWRHLGDARMCQERFADAARAYGQALRLNPLDEAARQYADMALKKTRRQQGRCLFPKQQALLHMQRQHRLTQVQRAGGGWLWLGPEHMELLPADSGRRSWSVCHDVGLRKVVVSPAADKVIAIEELPAGVWALDSGLLESTLSNGERHYCLTPDGLHCVVGLVELRIQKLSDGSFGRPLRGHQKQVLTAIFCGGNRLLTGACDRTARIWDVDKAICLHTLQGHRDYVSCLGCSSESGLVITGSLDGTARVWRLETGEFHRLLDEGTPVQAVAFARRGRYAVVQTGLDGEPQTSLWEMESNKLVRQLPGFSRISPDGDFLLTARQHEGRHVLEVREVEGGCLRRTFFTEDGPISDCCFSDDGRFLAVVTLSGSFYLFEFDEAYRVLPRELMLTYTRGGLDLEESHERFLGLLSKAEQALAEGDYTTSRRYVQEAREVPGYRRDPEARALTRQLTQHLSRGALLSCWEARLMGPAGGPGPCPIVQVPGGTDLLTASDKVMRLWNSQLGNCQRDFSGHSESIRALAVTSDGTRAVSGSLDRGVRCWDLETGKCLARVAASRGGVIGLHCPVSFSSLAVALTNQYLLSGVDFDSGRETFQTLVTGLTWLVGLKDQVWLGGPVAPGRMQIVDAKTGQIVRKLSASDNAEATMLATAAATFGAGRFGVSAGPDGRIHLWDLAEGRHLGQLLDIQARATHLAVSPDGFSLVVALENGWVQLWDLEKRLLCQVLEGPWGRLTGLGLSQDCCEIYILGSDQILRIWQMDWELLEATPRRLLPDTLPKSGLFSRLWRGLRG